MPGPAAAAADPVLEGFGRLGRLRVGERRLVAVERQVVAIVVIIIVVVVVVVSQEGAQRGRTVRRLLLELSVGERRAVCVERDVGRREAELDGLVELLRRGQVHSQLQPGLGVLVVRGGGVDARDGRLRRVLGRDER